MTLEELEAKVNQLDEKIDQLDEKVDEVESRVTAAEERLTEHEGLKVHLPILDDYTFCSEYAASMCDRPPDSEDYFGVMRAAWKYSHDSPPQTGP